MKIVKTGAVSRIFSDDLQTFDALPVGNYKICFHPMMGFYLEDMDVFKTTEQSYGKHPVKIAKIMRLYETIERSVGVIFSGKKGMGKSMASRELSAQFAEKYGMPTILVTEAHVGIVDFIESIKQECVVLFDEFEKVFDNGANHGNGFDPRPDKIDRNKESQDKLLGLFDGISQTKRLYVITCNELRKVNQYMINRPGRFHYHIQFNYPSKDEVQLYLKDKLLPEFHNQIALVQRFSNRFDLNYDSLRAIAFELNMGYDFMETLEDLNISSSENEAVKYNIAIHFSNGSVATTQHNINLLGSQIGFGFNVPSCSQDYVSINIAPLDIEIDSKSYFVAENGKVPFTVHMDDDNSVLLPDSGIVVERIVFTKQESGRPYYGKEMAPYLAGPQVGDWGAVG